MLKFTFSSLSLLKTEVIENIKGRLDFTEPPNSLFPHIRLCYTSQNSRKMHNCEKSYLLMYLQRKKNLNKNDSTKFNTSQQTLSSTVIREIFYEIILLWNEEHKGTEMLWLLIYLNFFISV